jgi:signal peptidase I
MQPPEKSAESFASSDRTERQDAGAKRPLRRMVLTALFGGLAFPGLGHWLIGKGSRGVFWSASTCAAILAGLGALVWHPPSLPPNVFFSLVVVANLLMVVSAVDAARLAWTPRPAWGSWWKRGLAVIAAAVVCVSGLVLIAAALRLHVCEAFSVPTNGMAPAAFGRHVRESCPRCGATADVAVAGTGPGARPSFVRTRGFCAACGSWFDPADPNPVAELAVLAGDRILVNKTLKPRRWDVIAYRPPLSPGEVYLHRLVGLPGETVEIRGGELLIDGVAATPPPHLAYLDFALPNGLIPEPNGGPGRPVRLEAGEHFVLGDNSLAALDSRFWKTGPGLPRAFAVRTEAIIGVATHCYWPPDRARVIERTEP